MKEIIEALYTRLSRAIGKRIKSIPEAPSTYIYNDYIKEGNVREIISKSEYIVELSTGEEVLAIVSGKDRMSYILLNPDDLVFVEQSPYDSSRGRLMTYSHFKGSRSRFRWTDLHRPKPW